MTPASDVRDRGCWRSMVGIAWESHEFNLQGAQDRWCDLIGAQAALVGDHRTLPPGLNPQVRLSSG